MKLPRRLLASAFAVPFFLLSQQPAAAPQAGSTFKSTSQEVALDLIVRDKKGKQIKDLQLNEIQVSDNGAAQQIKSFRLIGGGDITAVGQQPGAAPAAVRMADPQRQVRVVTFAFERLGSDGRNLARQAALELLKAEAGPNVYYAVFSIDQRLSILQQYTTDREAEKNAVIKATTAGYSLYSDESDRIAQELKIVGAQNAAGATIATPGAGGVSAEQGAAMANAQMAQMTLNMLQFAQTMERTQQSRASIYGLESLVREQYRLPGRKTLLYFSEGMNVTPEMEDRFKAIISTANRANVSVYCMDVRGLVTYNQNGSGGSQLTQATSSSRTQVLARNGPVTPDQARGAEIAESSMRANVQNKMEELSVETGGAFIANTNDFKGPLRRINEEIGSYYEVTYTPQIDMYDGTFRKIAVNVSRPDLRVQTRSGYFALPSLEGQTLLPYEVPMLRALSTVPVPRTIPLRSTGLHFQGKGGAPETVVVIDIPLEGIAFKKDETAQAYQMHMSVMAICKNSKGEVIQKLSRDLPVEGPLSNLEATRAGHFIYTQHIPMPAGRYTLETAVLDRETMKVSAKKQALIVPGTPAGVSISALGLVRSVAPLAAAEQDIADPLQFKGGKVTLSLDDTVKSGAGAKLSLYFTAYPQAGVTEPTKLVMEFLQDGKAVVRGEPELPPADELGRIAYIATMPIDTLKPGQYEVRVTAIQAGKAAQEHMFLNVE
ncbi:MAG: VWA domain-containing protein [Bryobacteraceae bacterium]